MDKNTSTQMLKSLDYNHCSSYSIMIRETIVFARTPSPEYREEEISVDVWMDRLFGSDRVGNVVPVFCTAEISYEVSSESGARFCYASNHIAQVLNNLIQTSLDASDTYWFSPCILNTMDPATLVEIK